VKFLGVEVPERVVEAIELRMKSGVFGHEDLLAVCESVAPDESREFHQSVPDKMIQSYRRLGRVREIARGQWIWQHPLG
jgi:hypothetical protein